MTAYDHEATIHRNFEDTVKYLSTKLESSDDGTRCGHVLSKISGKSSSRTYLDILGFGAVGGAEDILMNYNNGVNIQEMLCVKAENKNLM